MGAVALTLATAGCGSSPSAPSTPPPTTSASAQVLATAEVHPLRTLASPPPGSVGARWTLLGLADGGRRVLLETVASGGCAVFAGVLVTESTSLVTISPRTLAGRSSGELCPDHQVLTVGSVELSAPLGGRRLSEGRPSYPR